MVSEVFQRCLALRSERGQHGPVTIYDPCCGSAYHLSALAHLHADAIARIIASDINEDILTVAWRNLDLLTLDGMDRRMVDALLPLISPQSVVAIVADKGQSIRHEQYRRLDRFQVGKRQIVILSLF